MIKSKNKMGRACGTYWRQERYTRFWWGDLRVRDTLEDPVVDGRIILKFIFKKQDGRMNWIDLAQDRDMWRLLWVR